MILNPPPVICLMRTWTLVTEKIPAAFHAEYLAVLFRHLLPLHLTYDHFMESYHLYLQQIPQPLATEAWGINVAANTIRPTIPNLSNQTKPTT